MTRSACFATATGLALASLAALGWADDKPRSDNAERGRLEGTWELTFDDAPEKLEVKIINQTHFVWVTYFREDGKPLLMGGGTYTFDGKTYKEKYEFGGPGLPAELVGKEQIFAAELDGDKWTHSGTLSNDFEVREIWRRVRGHAAKPTAVEPPPIVSTSAPDAVPTSNRPQPTPPSLLTVSPPNAIEPPARVANSNADSSGKHVTFQVTVGIGSMPVDIRGSFTVTPVPPAGTPKGK
jgi:hypothetical protein